jgi:membrane fusion protein, epimerase transport system
LFLDRAMPPGTVVERTVGESARGTILLGGAIVFAFFGIFGGWAALSPLDGAIVAEAVVAVEGNRKSVDHLEGGTVREIRVKEGDHVTKGQVLLVLDDERLRAQTEIFAQQMAVAQSTEARLVAELGDSDSISFPELLTTSTAQYVQRAVQSQVSEFNTRREALSGSEQVLGHRIEDLQNQIVGKQSRQKASEEQLASMKAERASLDKLFADGLTTRERLLALDRAISALGADIAESQTAIASAEENIAQTRQQIVQLNNDRRTEIAKDLGDVQSRILDLGPTLANARDALARTIVRAPYDGKVLALQVFSTGAVVPPGGTVLDIVPDRNALVVEARVRVEDISDVLLGSSAEVHLTTYKRLYVPTLYGTVNTISADRLTDPRTGAAYFLAQVMVDPEELSGPSTPSLYPGMPAQVMITTQKRSALEYLLGPLFASFDGAFRQN